MRKDIIYNLRILILETYVRMVIDISFSNIQRNGNIAELLAYLTAVKMRGEG